jgi:hypothetical protein
MADGRRSRTGRGRRYRVRARAKDSGRCGSLQTRVLPPERGGQFLHLGPVEVGHARVQERRRLVGCFELRLKGGLDVEVMTPHYRGAHAAGKSGSGFQPLLLGRSAEGDVRAPPSVAAEDFLMIFDKRVQAVAKKGFTERQARFLTTVMLHTGVCVPRSTRASAASCRAPRRRGSSPGSCGFGYASMYDTRHNRARIYHLNQRSALCGHREPTAPSAAACPSTAQSSASWCSTPSSKTRIWSGWPRPRTRRRTSRRSRQSPRRTCRTPRLAKEMQRTVRYFPERLPIGIHPRRPRRSRLRLQHPRLDAFRLFVARHAAVLRALPVWTLRIVVHLRTSRTSLSARSRSCGIS